MNSIESPIKRQIYLSLILVILAGCSAISPQQTPTEEPQVIPDSPPIVSATGIVVPDKSTTLSMSTSGILDEVLIEEGDVVENGQVIVRLKGKEEFQAAISAAEVEIAAAQNALDDLYENAEITLTQKQEELARQAKVLRDAQYQLDNFTVPVNQTNLETMEALDLMKERLDNARQAFSPYRYRPSSNPTREDRKDDLEEAQSDFDSAVKRLEYENELKVAEANFNKARDDYNKYVNGPDPAEVMLAEARLKNANDSLAAAVAALEDLELQSRFDGTISEVFVHEGEWVTPGQPIVLLADFHNLRIETTDLNEIDAARVKVGDTVIVTFDALPDVVVNGTVESIAPKASQGSGVNYKAVIVLEEIPDQLRWDMTAFVDIVVDD